MQGWVWAVPTLLSLGLIDYLLRLPGVVRLVIGVGLLTFAGWWVTTRLMRVIRFRPTIEELAIRLERIYPDLTGRLSSALAFAMTPERFATPHATAAMAKASVSQVQSELAGVRVQRLIDTRPMRWKSGNALLATVLLGVIILAAPQHAAIAAQRWAMPLGDAAWPKITDVSWQELREVHPVDTALPMHASVGRGFKPGMRVWLHTRLTAPNGSTMIPEPVLMTEQVSDLAVDDGGGFHLLWKAPAEVTRAVSSDPQSSYQLESWIVAGDMQTPVQKVQLVARPTLSDLSITIRPPNYAVGLVPEQRLELTDLAQQRITAAALRGSTVELDLAFNKALPDASRTVETMLPGLADQMSLAPSSDAMSLRASFVLDEKAHSDIVLKDEYGFLDSSERSLRFEVIGDRKASVVMLEPAADTSVLPTARVPLEARGDDDVGLSSLQLRSTIERVNRLEQNEDQEPTLITEVVGRQPTLNVKAMLNLESLELEPGDLVLVDAVARDVYRLDDQTHEPVESTPRRLRIIDRATMIEQARSDLAGVRRQAVRLQNQQADLIERDAQAGSEAQRAGQQRVTEGIASQARRVEQLRERLDRNRLDESSLDELIQQSRDLLDQAQQAADQATRQMSSDNLSEPSQALRENQQRAADRLNDLIALLDQGRDALGMQLDLSRLKTEQENLAQDTRELLPQTVGRPTEALPDDVKQQLKEIADRQGELTNQAREMIEQMRTAAERLSKQSENDADKAQAQAIAEAAAIAAQQGLTQTMQEAQEASENNQLSQAGQQQQQALDTLEQMMNEMGDQAQLRQEMLKRRLIELAQKLERLIQSQEAELAAMATTPADKLDRLAEPQSKLWVLTLAAQEQAEADDQTAEVAPPIGAAAAAQARAIQSLRQSRGPDADRQQRDALARLNEALKLLRDKQAQANQDEQQQAQRELQAKYRDLAEQQQQLIDTLKETVGDGEINRRLRVQIRRLSSEQDTIRQTAATLGDEVADTLVFRQTHRVIDAAAEQASDGLKRGDADASVQANQAEVHRLLESMAEALDPDGGNAEFAQDPSNAGGAGSGGGGESPLVPPVAELKLLRSVQQAVYEETRRLNEKLQTPPTEAQSTRLTELSTQQRELSKIGRELIDNIRQAMQPPAPEAQP